MLNNIIVKCIGETTFASIWNYLLQLPFRTKNSKQFAVRVKLLGDGSQSMVRIAQNIAVRARKFVETVDKTYIIITCAYKLYPLICRLTFYTRSSVYPWVASESLSFLRAHLPFPLQKVDRQTYCCELLVDQVREYTNYIISLWDRQRATTQTHG